VARVAAGAIAKQILASKGIQINAFVNQVGNIKLEKHYSELNFQNIESNIVRCPDETTAQQMIQAIEEVKKQGDTLGGTIQCVIQNTPIGLGEPVFDKLHAVLAHAMLSINAAHGFEYGSGFAGASKKGSENNDEWENVDGKIRTKTNHAGGILGGIATGEDIYFNVAFKPIATILKQQQSINSKGEEITFQNEGRHDPCVLPRAVPIIEAMAALVLVDFLLLSK
jgi:chorismate synthase